MNPRRVLILILFITFLAIGLSVPSNQPISFSIFGYDVERVLSPLAVHIQTERVSIHKEPQTVMGLDIAGGARLVYEADMSQIEEGDIESALESTRNIIEQRVNLFGVSEPVIQTSKTQDTHRVIVELPGVTNVASAKDLIGQTAQLSFRQFPDDEEATASAFFFPALETTEETGLTGKDLKRARIDFDQNNGTPVVALEFTKEGADLFSEITQQNIGKNLPVFIDTFPVTNPTVNEQIIGGEAVISGDFTTDEAKQLAIQLNSGALPVPISVVEEKTIGPSLGQESVEKSVRAGAIGLLLVMAFMWAYYGKLGLLANVALIIYGLITYALFRMIPITLTLPGIAGFILSIGMAVDSNILIFERIREEVRSGRAWNTAMEVGFGRAWDSIRDANVTTLLTCFILFNPFNWEFLPMFGLARGFAATLAIGILVSLFTGVFVTRNLVRVFMGGGK
jgi:preprotein translocase subunit SecD